MGAMKGRYFRGGFVSAKADVVDASVSEFRLRRTFTLERPVKEAWLQGIGDEKAVFRLNGREALQAKYIYQNGKKGNHASVAQVGGLLTVGENVLEADYTVTRTIEYGMGRRFPGGVLCELLVRHDDGSVTRVDSDGTFESSVDGKTWTDVAVSPPPPAAPHPCRLEYVDFEHPVRRIAGGPAKAELRRGERVRFDYVFAGARPEGPITVRLALVRDGVPHWKEEVDASVGEEAADGSWHVAFDLEVPRFISAGRYAFSAESNSLYADPHAMDADLVLGGDGAPSGLLEVEMKPHGGQPTVHVNGRPRALLWGCPVGFKRPGGIPRHSDMPLNLVTVGPDYRQWHPSHGVYRLGLFDLAVESQRRQNPDAWFMIDLQIYPPDDFARRHPEEMSADETGDREPVGRFSYSYASAIALAEMREMVEKAIRYVEASPYADRVLGYRVNSGVTIEWLGWEAKPGRAKDFSAPNARAFAAFAAARYPELQDPHVPTFAERTALDAANDLLWNRKDHLNAIAYNEYNSWIIQKDLLEMCGCAKDVLARIGRKKLVGTYYGYTFYLNTNGKDVWRGHFALDDLLRDNAGRVDYLMSPQSYGVRRIGDPCGEMKPFSTLQQAGILSVLEDDTRTHSVFRPDYFGFGQARNAAQSVALGARNGAFALCRRSVPYYLALSNGVDYDYPEAAGMGTNLLRALEVAVAKGVGRSAEIALVASERSVCAMPQLNAFRVPGRTGVLVQEYRPDGTVRTDESGGRPLTSEIFMRLPARFGRSGAPVDYLLAEDLPRHAGAYKLYVFLNQFTYDDAIRDAVRRIQARGATCLWLYAPGYLRDNSLGAMADLTGIPFVRCGETVRAGVTMAGDGRWMGMSEARVAQMFAPASPEKVLGTYENGQPGVAVCRVGRSVNVFSGTWQLDLPFIRQLIRDAGVFSYCDSGDPLEACDSFVTLHARTAGTKTIRLPRTVETVIDVFNGRIVARDADAFAFDAALHSTHLFYCGNEEDWK